MKAEILPDNQLHLTAENDAEIRWLSVWSTKAPRQVGCSMTSGVGVTSLVLTFEVPPQSVPSRTQIASWQMQPQLREFIWQVLDRAIVTKEDDDHPIITINQRPEVEDLIEVLIKRFAKEE